MQKRKLQILVTNDDSYTSQGIELVAEMLSKYGDVTVVAPKYPQSGKSAALTLDAPLRCNKIASFSSNYNTSTIIYALTGTPADCVKWAANFVYATQKPDLVVSGINHGSNTSAAAVYSGTLGAAAEGCLWGVPSVGISIDTHHPAPDFSAVERYLPQIIEKIIANPPAAGIYYNINFPNLPHNQIKGIRAASQGKGRWVKEYEKRTDPKGADYYWMTGNFEDLEDSPAGDHKLVEKGYISIVPHKTDTTDYSAMAELEEKFNLNSEI